MMNSSTFQRTIKLGVKNLLLHTGRSALTMLGIVFGVASVISMLAVGEGASRQQQEAIIGLGSKNIIIKTVKPEDQGNTQGGNTGIPQYGITGLDAYRILKTVPNVTGIMPLRILSKDGQYARRKRRLKVLATLPGYQQIRELFLLRGRFLSVTDEREMVNSCVVTENVAANIFGFNNPVGQSLKLGEFYFRVVGVVASTTGEMENKEDVGTWDLRVFIPVSTCKAMFGETIISSEAGSFQMEQVQFHELIVECKDLGSVEDAALGVQRVMEHFHDQVDYELTVPLRLLQHAEKTKRVFTIVLGSIAAISLLVGGIGIMNIMLATVTERTREIGVRRALGARRKDIVIQFLVETVVLSIGGGLVGVALGVVIPLQISNLTDVETVTTAWSLLLAFGVSGVIGIVFGLYPAARAAALDPIQALRHE